MDKACKKAARVALDEYQLVITSTKTLGALAAARVRFAEQLTASLPLSDDDRVQLVNALLGREDPRPVQSKDRTG